MFWHKQNFAQNFVNIFVSKLFACQKLLKTPLDLAMIEFLKQVLPPLQ